MKQTALKFYQVLNNFKHMFLISNLGVSVYCKHSPSCSEYLVNQIESKGFLKGSIQGIKRFLTCY